MNEPALIYIFNICIIIGFLFPLLNIVTGWFGSLFGVGVDLEADFSGKGIFPFNIMCLSLFLVVFGALGHAARPFMAAGLPVVLLLAGCAGAAGFSYWALYKLLVKRLKENDASALSYHNLRGKRCEVTLSISGDGMGTISMRDSTGAAISFRAKIDPDLKSRMPETIPKGEQVIITEVDVPNKLCYVSMYISRIAENKN